jgi:hypothetical protein
VKKLLANPPSDMSKNRFAIRSKDNGDSSNGGKGFMVVDTQDSENKSENDEFEAYEIVAQQTPHVDQMQYYTYSHSAAEIRARLRNLRNLEEIARPDEDTDLPF